MCEPSTDNLISIHAPAKGATLRDVGGFSDIQFQSTLPRRERLRKHFSEKYPDIFQSTLPRRERPGGVYLGDYVFGFQSTLPRRERLDEFISTYWKFDFNPRSREGSDTAYLFHAPGAIHFNPRSREGSDVDILRGLCYDGISIHAPAKGATESQDEIQRRIMISIHAPAKGATCKCCLGRIPA